MSRYLEIFENIMKQEFGNRLSELSIELSAISNHYCIKLIMPYFSYNDMVKVVTRITKIMWMITKWSIMSIGNEISISFYVTPMADD